MVNELSMKSNRLENELLITATGSAEKDTVADEKIKRTDEHFSILIEEIQSLKQTVEELEPVIQVESPPK